MDLISRQAAIDVIEDYPHGNVWNVESMEEMVDKIKALPSAERNVAPIQDFVQYQVDWLTEHNDLELESELEDWVIRFLQDTADCYDKEYLTPTRRKGYWKHTVTYYPYCSECGWLPEENEMLGVLYNYCPNCGADMRGEEDDS